MRKLKERLCNNCGSTYLPTGSCSKYCLDCKPEMRRQLANKGTREYKRRLGCRVGEGSGCTTGKGKDNHMWKNGISIFLNNRAKTKLERRYCGDCGKDLIDATHYMWVIHHIDHDKFNNPEDGSNWKLLCKRCHQIEHECWKGYEGATTSLIRLPNGRYARDERSPQESGEARDTQTFGQVGDDIVWANR
jgi:HNH endonuclease